MFLIIVAVLFAIRNWLDKQNIKVFANITRKLK